MGCFFFFRQLHSRRPCQIKDSSDVDYPLPCFISDILGWKRPQRSSPPTLSAIPACSKPKIALEFTLRFQNFPTEAWNQDFGSRFHSPGFRFPRMELKAVQPRFCSPSPGVPPDSKHSQQFLSQRNTENLSRVSSAIWAKTTSGRRKISSGNFCVIAAKFGRSGLGVKKKKKTYPRNEAAERGGNNPNFPKYSRFLVFFS